MDHPIPMDDNTSEPIQPSSESDITPSDAPPLWYEHASQANGLSAQSPQSALEMPSPPQIDPIQPDGYYKDHIDHNNQSNQPDNLLKIGEVAKLAGESVSTIRFWVYQGLLLVSGRNSGGYQLFHPSMVERAREIRRLQTEHRLRIAEIKQYLPPV